MPNGRPIQMSLFDKSKRLKDPMKDRLDEGRTALSTGTTSPKFSRYGYDCIMRTKEYHVIQGQGLEKGRLKILPNTLEYQDTKFGKRHTALFQR